LGQMPLSIELKSPTGETLAEVHRASF